MNRRHFIASSASAAGLVACSQSSSTLPTAFVPQRSTSAPLVRLEIQEFSKNTRLVNAFRRGVKAMMALRPDSNTGSWNYWHYSHWMPDSNPPPEMETVWDQCKHRASYFAAWHRGFLVFFEQELRKASGDATFTLPYWDYYKNPNLPAIFTEPTLVDEPNPLYWKNRKQNVVMGLSFKPFADTITTFPWGPGETYEDLLEVNPHGRVHTQIGGSMGQVPTAAADPIFWVHHCNIDRLWSAWEAAGKGRHMPAKGDLWWKETFFYNLDRTWRASVSEMNDTTNLGYAYAHLDLPQPVPGAAIPARPRTVAPARPLVATLQPITVELEGSGSRLQLEGVRLLGAARNGGVSFSLYANLPEAPTPLARASAFEIGEIGSFELSMPSMKGMGANGTTLAFDLGKTPAKTVAISIVPYGKPAGAGSSTPLLQIDRMTVSTR